MSAYPPSPPDEEGRWYYTDAGNQAAGPVVFSELQRLAAAGLILPAALVIQEGGVDWKPMASFLPTTGSVQPIARAAGRTGSVELFADRIRVSHQGFAAMRHRSSPVIDVPLTNIRLLHLKVPRFSQGFLQVVLQGGAEPSDNLFAAVQDRLTVLFSRRQEAAFRDLQQKCEGRLGGATAVAAGTPGASSAAWHYVDAAGQTIGPTSFESLRALARGGKISHDTYVFPQGGPTWKKYGDAEKASLPPVPLAERKSGKLERAFAGGCIGLLGASVPFTIGFLLCLTGIGAIVGIPLMLLSVMGIAWGPVLGLAFGPKGYISGVCPSCGHGPITSASSALGLECPACKKRILIRGKAFVRVD